MARGVRRELESLLLVLLLLFFGDPGGRCAHWSQRDFGFLDELVSRGAQSHAVELVAEERGETGWRRFFGGEELKELALERSCLVGNVSALY